MAKLDDAAIQKALAGVPDWRREGDAIRRQFTLGSFPDGGTECDVSVS